jgi:hypothetical protein
MCDEPLSSRREVGVRSRDKGEGCVEVKKENL